MTNQSNEIDLIYLLRSFISFTKLNKLKLILAFIFINISIYCYFEYIVENQFTSYLTATSKAIDVDEVQAITTSLNNHLKSKNYQRIAQLLEIPEKDASFLISFSAAPLYDPLSQESKKEKDPKKFMISAKSKSPLIFENLSLAIIKYLKNNTYFKTKSNIYFKEHQEIITKTELLIQTLDTANPKLLYHSLLKGSSSPSLYISNPGELSESIVKLLKENSLQKELIQEYTDILVIQHMENFTNVTNKNLKNFVLISILLSLLLSYIVVLAFKKG